MRRDYHDARPSVTMTGTGDDRSLSHGPRYPGPGPASCSGLGPAAAPASATRAVTREGHADSDGDPPPAAPPGQRPGRRAEGGGPRTVTGLERLRTRAGGAGLGPWRHSGGNDGRPTSSDFLPPAAALRSSEPTARRCRTRPCGRRWSTRPLDGRTSAARRVCPRPAATRGPDMCQASKQRKRERKRKREKRERARATERARERESERGQRQS